MTGARFWGGIAVVGVIYAVLLLSLGSALEGQRSRPAPPRFTIECPKGATMPDRCGPCRLTLLKEGGLP